MSAAASNHAGADYDVVVIGSGCAGLSAAVAAEAAGASVLIVTDRNLGSSNSALAQGGLQHVVDSAEEADLVEDMIGAAGTADIDAELIAQFASEVGPSVSELIGWGLSLDLDSDGELARRLAGAMSSPRVVTARGKIGPPVMKLLLSKVRGGTIEILENQSVDEVVPTGDGFRVCAGTTEVAAQSVVCATGGRSWQHAVSHEMVSSNPANSNHRFSDSLLGSLCLRTVDDDLYQFQPFGDLDSVVDGVGKLIPETLAVSGPRILDRDGREVVAPTAGRHQVTSAMAAAHEEGRSIETENGSGFLLTLSDVDVDEIAAAYPALHRRLRSGGRLGEDLVVTPFLHYQLGGFAFTDTGESSYPGLFVAGEMTGGLHGANRLMGNGITDALVHGRRAGRNAAERSVGLRK